MNTGKLDSEKKLAVKTEKYRQWNRKKIHGSKYRDKKRQIIKKRQWKQKKTIVNSVKEKLESEYRKNGSENGRKRQ